MDMDNNRGPEEECHKIQEEGTPDINSLPHSKINMMIELNVRIAIENLVKLQQRGIYLTVRLRLWM